MVFDGWRGTRSVALVADGVAGYHNRHVVCSITGIQKFTCVEVVREVSCISISVYIYNSIPDIENVILGIPSVCLSD